LTAPDRLLAATVFREEAERHSFVRVGIAAASAPARFERFRGWIEAGHHAGMKYLETTRETRADPTRLLAGARSIVCLAARQGDRPLVAADGATVVRVRFDTTEPRGSSDPGRPGSGREARRFRGRLYSTPPSNERAAVAGVGWIGKNGCLIDSEHGSFLLLAIVTDLISRRRSPNAAAPALLTRADACPRARPRTGRCLA
jgi:epoxyqueuosine reductase